MFIQLAPKHKQKIDALLIQFPYVFFVFGSRAKNKATERSDLDLCIKQDISIDIYAHLKEQLNNLLLPFSVDLVIWNHLSSDFKKHIEKDLKRYVIDPQLCPRPVMSFIQQLRW